MIFSPNIRGHRGPSTEKVINILLQANNAISCKRGLNALDDFLQGEIYVKCVSRSTHLLITRNVGFKALLLFSLQSLFLLKLNNSLRLLKTNLWRLRGLPLRRNYSTDMRSILVSVAGFDTSQVFRCHATTVAIHSFFKNVARHLAVLNLMLNFESSLLKCLFNLFLFRIELIDNEL